MKGTKISKSTPQGSHALQDDSEDGGSHITSNSTPESIPTDSLTSNSLKVDTSSVAGSTNIASSEPFHLSQSKDIVYDRWLYLFCIGIVFRGIAYISRKSYVNNNELYSLFVKCRECLLKAPHIDDVDNLPVVEIWIHSYGNANALPIYHWNN